MTLAISRSLASLPCRPRDASGRTEVTLKRLATSQSASVSLARRDVKERGQLILGAACLVGGRERCGTMRIELSALFERESAPVAQWIRAADFGLSPPMRCSPSVGGGSVERRVICSLPSYARVPSTPAY